MSDEIILVDFNDNIIGSGEKLWVHRSDRLHRAFSVFIVRDGKMLIQQRNFDKYHSGGLWANACCSHQRVEETLELAVERRLVEELGIKAKPEEIAHFTYRTEYDNGLTEYEYDHVFFTDTFTGELKPNPEEIAQVRWIGIEALKEEMLSHPETFSSWFMIAAPMVFEHLAQ